MKKWSHRFDVSMGAYDAAEVLFCEGIFLLYFLGRQCNTKNIGLYRDDGLSIFKNCSGPQLEKIKKQLQKVFKNNRLDVIIQCNIKIVSYLDVTNNIIQYIHVECNHPPNIIKKIPKTIENVFPSSPPMKIYSMNQHDSMQINYTSLATNKNSSTTLLKQKLTANVITEEI